MDYEVNISDFLSDGGAILPSEYQYYKGLKERRIIISGDIGQDILQEAMLPLIQMDNDGSGKPIEIILATPGGSVFDAMTLCDVIDKLKTPTTIVCANYAYSMGSLILMAGYDNPNVTKVCYKHSTALLHAGNDYLEGDASSVKDTFHFIEKYEALIKNYTLSHTAITPAEYKKMERSQWYMVADDMLKYKLVDKIL